ncbi:MAG TPA: aldehyde dehydrogenase family protein, partial [Solirubrobacteraceae bacterium]|nr:aldehyde dehydrogenase family protein [Solirubrobacteraceae bacterium]
MTATLPVHSPYSGELVGEAPLSGAQQVRALLDAGAAYTNDLSRHERSQILFKVSDAITRREDELAALITAESGLCMKDSRYEIGRAADVFRFAAVEALRDDGEAFSGDVSEHGR